jgi:pyruvate formate lyase activating enzyme
LWFDRRNGAQTLIGQTITLDDIVAEIQADEIFYYRSGGGVTLSGGEPTAQPDFARSILASCAHAGIHTAMETSGFTSWETLESMLTSLDLLYYDIKHLDADTHLRLTGVSNDRILDNFRRLRASFWSLPVIVRVPVVPGLNDSRDNMEATARFVAESGGAKRVELLPYHRYGVHSYELLGREYGLQDLPSPAADHLEALMEMISGFGVEVQIGG